MGYSNFRTIKTVIRRFNLDLQMQRLFGEVAPVAPSPWLQETLAETEFFPPTNEKAKSERIISPVLTEVARQWKGRISFFSGENIDIDPVQDLSGPCGFFFALQPVCARHPRVHGFERSAWGLADHHARLRIGR